MDRASGAGTPHVELRLLGPIEVERDGVAPALGGQKPRALLAVLALEPARVVSVDRLVEALWPGDPPETAAHAVQVYVSQLRKALGPVIATRAPGYVLELDPEHVDVHRFSRLAQEGRAALGTGEAAAAEVALREALALWRGPALADFVYEPFAQTQIARLEELRTVVVEERVDADLALGRHAELVSELEALVQAEPLRERPRAQLMLALYRSGRQADALAAYRAARETLVEELGIDPGPELRELEAAILRQDDSLLLEEAPLARPAMQFRRLVTILFVDVVESMALAEALDPETLGTVLRSYFETVSAAIVRHGGTVEKYAGDAVMAAFGIPVSHEDDALRAARAALDIRIGIAALNEQLVQQHGIGLEIRIGIETGEVVATPTDARQRLVTGEAVGIASKLEGSAAADTIVVGELAGRLIDHAAVLEPLGAIEIKGKRDPVQAYRLLELSPIAPTFAQRQDARLVGRKRELAALRRTLKRAVDGSAVRVAVVIGSPGVGKSRLATELTRRAKGVTTLWGRCLSYGEGITYWPLREALDQAGASNERDAVLAALDAETPPPAPELAWLFRQFCEASARDRPLVLVFDDVHWAEPTFLELVEHLADKGEEPIAIVCLAREELVEDRPEFLEGRANADMILLDALSADETDALLEGLGWNDRSSRTSAPASPRPPRETLSSSSSSSPSRWKGASPNARCRRRSRRCSPRASTGSAPASAPCSSAEPSSGRSSRPRMSSRSSIPTRPPRRTCTCRRSRTADSYGWVETPCSASGTSSCRSRSIGRHRSAFGPSSTSATPTGSTRSRPISLTSTSSSATTSSRRTGCGQISASRIGALNGWPRMGARGWARPGFEQPSAATCRPRRTFSLEQ